MPESGSDLGLSSHGLPEARKLNRCLVSTPHHSGLTVGLGRFMETVYPGSKAETVRGPPSAQSPFARLGRYLRRRDVQHLVRGRYSSFIALTDSCARPKSSRRLRLSLFRPVFAGCCQPLLEDGPSRRYLHSLCKGAWTHTPPRSCRSVRLDALALGSGASIAGHRPHPRCKRFGP